VTSQDLRVAELAMKSECATALVLNKWDVTGGAQDPRGPGGGIGADELDSERARVNQKLRSARACSRPPPRPAATSSACSTRRSRSPDRAKHRIPTPELNRFLADVTQQRQPPAKQGHRLKMLYMAQIGEAPPRFAIQVNSRQRVTRDYAYFVEKQATRALRPRGRPGDHRLRGAQEPLPN